MTLPPARREGLFVEDMEDEIVILDTTADRAHCLSRTSGLVWKECDGTSSLEQIAMRLGMADEVVALALDQLKTAGLLITPDESESGGVTRRQLIRGLGAAAAAGVLLPTIHSVAVPGVAAAQTADSCCAAASLVGDTVGIQNSQGPVVTRTVGSGIELPNAGPTLGGDSTPRWNIDIGANTIKIDFLETVATYGAGSSFTFSSLNPRVPPGCPQDLIPQVTGAQAFTNKPGVGYVIATFTATTVTVQFAPATANVDWNRGEYILVRLQYGCVAIPPPPPPTFDPCCPPWNAQKLAEMMVYQGTGGISAPFTLRFQPTPAFNTMLRAYIVYLNAVDPAFTWISMQFRLHDGGTGTTCAPGAQIGVSWYETWTPPISATGPTPVPNFFPSGSMVVNHWYRVHTGIYLNDNLSFFPHSCADNDICVRLQVAASAAEGSRAVTDQRAVLQIQMADGSVLERPFS